MVHDLSVNGVDPQCFAETDFDAFGALPLPNNGSGQLPFIRGFLPPSWLSLIGSKYMLDPEFMLRHMDIFLKDSYGRKYCYPSLVSTTSNIIRLCAPTIVHREEVCGPPNQERLSTCRRKQRAEMLNYRREAKTKTRCGDSFVREFATIDDHYSIIEQWMSICVVESGDGWVGK